MFNNESKIEKVAIYTRVSTEDQAKEGFSLDAQLKKLRAFCESRTPEWKIQDIYIDDGYTGTNIRRPAYKKMLENIDLWDGILVLKMDRIHRNSKNFLSMMEFLKKHEKEFISSQENFDTSNAMGRFVMNIIQLIAQLESEQNAERTTTGMIQKATDITKGWIGHNLAFGYKLDKNRNITEVPDEINLIKKIFKMYSEGSSIDRISKEINIGFSKIYYWLNNTWYIGLEHWGNCFKKINNGFKPIITLDTWNLCQVRKRKNGKSKILKPFILDKIPDTLTLSNNEMKKYGFKVNIIKNQTK